MKESQWSLLHHHKFHCWSNTQLHTSSLFPSTFLFSHYIEPTHLPHTTCDKCFAWHLFLSEDQWHFSNLERSGKFCPSSFTGTFFNCFSSFLRSVVSRICSLSLSLFCISFIISVCFNFFYCLCLCAKFMAFFKTKSRFSVYMLFKYATVWFFWALILDERKHRVALGAFFLAALNTPMTSSASISRWLHLLYQHISYCHGEVLLILSIKDLCDACKAGCHQLTKHVIIFWRLSQSIKIFAYLQKVSWNCCCDFVQCSLSLKH